MRFRWIISSLLALVTVTTVVITALSSKEGGLPLTVMAEERELAAEVRITGKLAALRSWTITSSLGAKIKSLAPEGSVVEKGDMVIEFEDAEIRHELEKARLELDAKKAEKELALAELEAQRQKMLLDIETHRTNAEVARLQLQELRREPTPSNLKIAQLEYQSAKAVLAIARKEYARLSQQKEGTLNEEIQKLETDLQQAVASYRKAELNLRLVSSGASFLEIDKTEAERDKALLQLDEVKKAMPDKITQLESKVEQAATQIEAAKNNLQKAEDELKKATIYAPFDGLVVYRTIWGQKLMEGTSYWNGAALMDLPDLSQMVLKGKVREHSIALVEVGQKAEIVVDGAPDETFVGEVTKIGKVAVDTSEKEIVGFLDKKGDTGIKVFEVLLKLEQKSPRLRPRMVARARIAVKKTSGVVVPKIALHHRGDKAFAFVENSGGGFDEVEVTLGPGNEREVIVKGIAAGKRVLLNPSEVDHGLIVEKDVDRHAGGDDRRRRPDDEERRKQPDSGQEHS